LPASEGAQTFRNRADGEGGFRAAINNTVDRYARETRRQHDFIGGKRSPIPVR
jgi:hypothetical protein